ncbi:DUF4269 domain-containing protein [Pedobacter antarcticus]|uniref:DUF4269 domain-containing protein n=1 Tax=Pedobacter antarcticus TaxID=34086 RepID=UPI001C58A37D|nr:DUF4269 domain-containing protein [Pedobacter antarcticus]
MPDELETFEDIRYLNSGNSRQKSAFATLQSYAILETLKAFDPLLVGTVPIGIDVDGSDLDIICNSGRAEGFQEILIENFSKFRSFKLYNTIIGGASILIARFYLNNWEIEIFGQELATRQQNGYRHMIAEYILLLVHGTELREKVIALKEGGMKTEPAFAAALDLKGDPYLALLELNLSDKDTSQS